jgi:hypothetical protein
VKVIPEYRIYSVSRDGDIVAAKELMAANDEIAISAAKLLLDGLDIEVWEGARVVTRVPSSPKIRPS